jgi:hypothetical protein
MDYSLTGTWESARDSRAKRDGNKPFGQSVVALAYGKRLAFNDTQVLGLHLKTAVQV